MTERKLSAADVARLWLGADATKKEIDSKKAQIKKWRNGAAMSDATAHALSRALDLPAAYFIAHARPRTVADEIAELRRDVRADYHQEMQQLRNELREEIRDAIREALGQAG